MANSVEQNKAARDETSHLGLHCLVSCVCVSNMTSMKLFYLKICSKFCRLLFGVLGLTFLRI